MDPLVEQTKNNTLTHSPSTASATTSCFFLLYIPAVFEASQLKTSGEEYETSIQGGLTSDGFCSILAALCTSMPNTTFSQNNGVISLTKCASRRAGYAAGVWLMILGIFGKVAGLITAIPDAVLGGMTIFLFANVLASGVALTGNIDLHSRRNKFILAMSLAIGVGVTVWPFAFQDMRASPYTAHFWTCEDCNDAVKGVRNGISIFLSTGYCVGTVIAMILNKVLPEDLEISYNREFIKPGIDLTFHPNAYPQGEYSGDAEAKRHLRGVDEGDEDEAEAEAEPEEPEKESAVDEAPAKEVETEEA